MKDVELDLLLVGGCSIGFFFVVAGQESLALWYGFRRTGKLARPDNFQEQIQGFGMAHHSTLPMDKQLENLKGLALQIKNSRISKT